MTVIATEGLNTRRAHYDQVDWDVIEPYQIEVRHDLLNLLPADTGSVLDLGCGNGIIANALPKDWNVIGVDISIAALKRLQRPACIASALRLPFADGAFDLVMANDVIEHFPDDEFDIALREIERVANRYIVTTVPFAENLEILSEYTGPSSAPHHINDHFRSFNLDILKNLYRNFELDCAVFSGGEWQRETRPVEAFASLIKKLQRAREDRSPSGTILTDDNAAILLRLLRMQQARDLGRQPEIIEFSQLRTEVICLYRRRDSGKQYPLGHAIRARSIATDAVPTMPIDLNVIDFQHLDRHLQPLLPTMSRFPYVVASAALCRSPGGTLFSAHGDSETYEIKVGFFCNSEKSCKLEISGSTASQITLSIAHYGALHDYRPVAREHVCGEFQLVLTDLDLSHSQYGILFSIAVSGGSLFLRNIRLTTEQSPAHRLLYARTPEYLSVKHDGIDCFLSCRFYGREVPVFPWFKTPICLPPVTAIQPLPSSLAGGIETTTRLAALLGSRLEEIVVRHEYAFHNFSSEYLARQTAVAEAVRQQQETTAHQLVELKRQIEEDRLSQADARDDAVRQLQAETENRLTELKLQIENQLAELKREIEEKYLARQRLYEEMARHQQEETQNQLDAIENRLVALKHDLEETQLIQRRLLGEADRRQSGIGNQISELRRELHETVAHIDSKFNITREKFIERIHSLGETLLRLELGSTQLAQRIHIVERVLSPLFPAARYVSRMRHSVRGRLAARHQVPAGEPPLAAEKSSSAAAKHGRTALMLVADDRIDRRVLAQARTLVAQGWRVTVVAAPFPGPIDLDQEAFPEVRISRIDTNLPAPPFAKPSSFRLSATRNWVEAYFYHDHFLERALRFPATIVTAHDLPVLPAAIAAAEISGARVVYDAHELYPEQHHFGPELSELYREVEREIIGFADAVTTVNLSIAHEMAKRYNIPLPDVVLNAPEVDRASLPLPRGNLLRERLNLPESRRILLFQGALSLNRNLENLTRAMSYVQTPDVALVFLGPGVEKRVELSEIASKAGTLGSRIFFLDAVDQRALLQYTASADVGIIPYPPIDLNSQLCTPNKLFEFIVAGVPILANDLPELRRFVYHNEFGQVHPLHDPESIAAAIDAMFGADLESYRQKLRDRCHEFTWEQQAGTIISLYERLFAEAQTSERP